MDCLVPPRRHCLLVLPLQRKKKLYDYTISTAYFLVPRSRGNARYRKSLVSGAGGEGGGVIIQSVSRKCYTMKGANFLQMCCLWGAVQHYSRHHNQCLREKLERHLLISQVGGTCEDQRYFLTLTAYLIHVIVPHTPINCPLTNRINSSICIYSCIIRGFQCLYVSCPSWASSGIRHKVKVCDFK